LTQDEDYPISAPKSTSLYLMATVDDQLVVEKEVLCTASAFPAASLYSL